MRHSLVIKFAVESRRAWGDYFDRDAPFISCTLFWLLLVIASPTTASFQTFGQPLVQHAGIAPVPDWSDKLGAAFQKAGAFAPTPQGLTHGGHCARVEYVVFWNLHDELRQPGSRVSSGAAKKAVKWATFPSDWTIRSLIYYSLALSLAAVSLGLLAVVVSKPQVLKRPRLIECIWIAARSLAFLAVLASPRQASQPDRQSRRTLHRPRDVVGSLILWTVLYLRPDPAPCGKLRRYLWSFIRPRFPCP